MISLIIEVPKVEIRTRYLVCIYIYWTVLIVLLPLSWSNQKSTLEDTILSLQAELKLKPHTFLVVSTEDPMPGFDDDVPIYLQHLFNEIGGKYGVEPQLLSAIARQESGFNTMAKSPAGAMGLMQLMPITIRHLKIKHGIDVDPWDDRSAIGGAAVYLTELQSYFNGPQVLAAYNMGPTRLRQLKGDFSSIQETTAYVKAISNSIRGEMSSKGM